MVLEAVAAALVGLAGLLLVLEPLLRTRRHRPPPPAEPIDPEETPRGIALSALKEIDFDRATGKLSESDYQFLKAKYTTLALEALRADESPADAEPAETLIAARLQALRGAGSGTLRCRICGPRPEPDALFCSTCGEKLLSSAAEPAPPVAPVQTRPIQAS
jgi:hypothetical protein